MAIFALWQGADIAAKTASVAPAGFGTLFAYGLLLNLMLGIFSLFLRLAKQLEDRKERARIFCRYAAGAAIGLAVLGIGFRGTYFGALYYNPWLTASAAAVFLPLWTETLGYMNIALFRPLKKIFRRGWLDGLFTVWLAAAFPTMMKAEAASGLFVSGADVFTGGNFVWQAADWADMAANFGGVWLGIMTLPLAVLAAAVWQG